jgi:hypothetical protein
MAMHGVPSPKAGILLLGGLAVLLAGVLITDSGVDEVRAAENSGRADQYADLLYAYDDPAYSEQRAIALAATAIRDYYAEYEVEKKAVPALESLLETVRPVPSRTAIRFLLADLHHRLNQRDKALEEYRAIIRENEADLVRRGY